ncbi:MBL fold metallo-hydrolase [Rhodococcus opacus]|uniref:MBL fold metallo-hydrolase n=1 Tax=Rhodococcus opacus TaxID=37919 RepID=UPI000B05F3B1|nr:MBL fold metallo-hydrolase [Rhodococcus opacus]
MNNTEDDEYEVVIIRYGTRETLRSKVFLNYEAYGESDGPIRMDYYFWVIRNAHRTFVVDTGYSEECGRHRGRHHLISPATALSFLGIDPDHATVIVTHAHYDHAGNLDLFPHSTVVIPATEYEFWMDRTRSDSSTTMPSKTATSHTCAAPTARGACACTRAPRPSHPESR